jgi:hypothetical protein
MPAQILVVAGLALTLFTPLIPRFRYAAVDSARMQFDNAEAMINLEMEELQKEQERERQQSNLALAGMSWEQQQVHNQEQQKRNAEMQRVAEEKREALQKQYDRTALKRRHLLAQNDAAGMRWHLLVGWLGEFALIVGLLALTATSSGVTQKIFLVVLLVVLFSALSGVRLDFLAAGQMGGQGGPSLLDGVQGRR